MLCVCVCLSTKYGFARYCRCSTHTHVQRSTRDWLLLNIAIYILFVNMLRGGRSKRVSGFFVCACAYLSKNSPHGIARVPWNVKAKFFARGARVCDIFVRDDPPHLGRLSASATSPTLFGYIWVSHGVRMCVHIFPLHRRQERWWLFVRISCFDLPEQVSCNHNLRCDYTRLNEDSRMGYWMISLVDADGLISMRKLCSKGFIYVIDFILQITQ